MIFDLSSKFSAQKSVHFPFPIMLLTCPAHPLLTDSQRMNFYYLMNSCGDRVLNGRPGCFKIMAYIINVTPFNASVFVRNKISFRGLWEPWAYYEKTVMYFILPGCCICRGVAERVRRYRKDYLVIDGHLHTHKHTQSSKDTEATKMPIGQNWWPCVLSKVSLILRHRQICNWYL